MNVNGKVIKRKVIIGKRLSKIRNEIGITQKELGNAIGCTYYHISNVERGLIRFKQEFWDKIEKEFNVNLDYLLKGKGSMFLDDNSLIEINNYHEIFYNIKKIINDIDQNTDETEKKVLVNKLSKLIGTVEIQLHEDKQYLKNCFT